MRYDFVEEPPGFSSCSCIFQEDRKYLSQILATMNEALADYAQVGSYWGGGGNLVDKKCSWCIIESNCFRECHTLLLSFH